MDADLFFTIGLFVAALAIPALVGAFSESRPPRAAAIMVMIAAGLILVAILEKPGGYTMGEIPAVVLGVLGNLVN